MLRCRTMRGFCAAMVSLSYMISIVEANGNRYLFCERI